MDSQKIQQVQNEIKKTSPLLLVFFILFGFMLVTVLIVALVLISPFLVIGYIFYLLFPFLKDLYRINRNYKFDKLDHEQKHN
jgi:predicted PurR-regulated permease PerM